MNTVALQREPAFRKSILSILAFARTQHWSVFLVIAYGLLIPVVAMHLPGIGGVGAADFLMPVAMFVCFCVRPKGKLQVSHIALLLFVLAALVSLLQINHGKDAVDCSIRWVRLLGILMPFFFGLFVANSSALTRQAVLAWGVGGLIAIVIGIVLHAFQIEVRSGQQKLWMDGAAQIRAGGLIGNSGAFGHMTATWGVVCVGYLLSVSRNRFRYIGAGVVLMLVAYVVYVSSSRAAMMHLGVALMALTVLLPTKRLERQWIGLAGAFGLMAAISIGGMMAVFGGGGGGETKNNALQTNLERFIPGLNGDVGEFTSNRADNWPVYIEMMSQSVISGWGYKMGVRLHEESPDNSYLSVMLETGLFGFACMATFVIAVLHRLVALYLIGNGFAVVMIAACLGQLANCMTSDIYTFWITMPVVFMLLGFVTQPSVVDSRTEDIESKSIRESEASTTQEIETKD